MPRYFFQIMRPGEPRDVEGQELADVQAAKCAAARLIADAYCGRPQAFWDADTVQVQVTDKAGMIQFMLDLFATAAPAVHGAPRRPPGG